MTVEERHLSEKFSVAQLSKGGVVAVCVFHADPHAAALDQVHGIAAIAAVKKRGPGCDLAHRQQVAQFLGGFFVERSKESYDRRASSFMKDLGDSDIAHLAGQLSTIKCNLSRQNLR